jgi:hypothetical protein
MQLTTAKTAIRALFMLCALLVGIVFTVLTPPGQANDEETHLIRTAGLLHGAILGVRKPGTDPATGKPILVAGVKCNPMVPLYVYCGTAC